MWRTLVRILNENSMSITEEIVGKLKQAVRDFMPQTVEEIEIIIGQAAQLTGQGAIHPLDDIVEITLERVDEEIEYIKVEK